MANDDNDGDVDDIELFSPNIFRSVGCQSATKIGNMIYCRGTTKDILRAGCYVHNVGSISSYVYWVFLTDLAAN